MRPARPLLRRALLVLAASAIALAALGVPASAIGAQGVDLEPLLRRVDGKLTAYLDQATTVVDLHVENLTAEERTGSIYVAETPRNAEGGLTVGRRAAWASIPEGEELTLAPEEERIVSVEIDLAAFREAETPRNAAIVLQVGTGSVVPRAATIITLVDGGAPLPVSLVLLLAAAGLVVIVGAFWVRTVQTYGLRPTAVSSPTPV